MSLRLLAIAFALLAALNGAAWWSGEARRGRSAESAFVDTPLVAPADLERAHRIVVREKPQSRVVHSEEGFEVRRVVDEGAAVREAVLVRRGDTWVVASYFDLDADMDWVGRTMSDLSQGRLTRFLTADPVLMEDLGFEGSLVRLEDEHGKVLRQIELGRRDGGETDQFVRLGGREAFVARHDAEILGDPLAWIVTRVLRFAPADVQDLELPVRTPGATPLRLRRAAPGAALRPRDEERGAAPDLVSEKVEALLAKLIAEPVLLAVPRDHPAAAAAAGNVVARWRAVLFDGRRYEVGYGVVPAGQPALSADMRNEDVTVLTATADGSDDLLQRYGARVALVYGRGGTLERLPKTAALMAPTAATGDPR